LDSSGLVGRGKAKTRWKLLEEGGGVARDGLNDFAEFPEKVLAGGRWGGLTIDLSEGDIRSREIVGRKRYQRNPHPLGEVDKRGPAWTDIYRGLG